MFSLRIKTRRYSLCRIMLKVGLACGMIATMCSVTHITYKTCFKQFRSTAFTDLENGGAKQRYHRNDNNMGNQPTEPIEAQKEEHERIGTSVYTKVKSGVIEYPNEKYHIIPDLLSSYTYQSVINDTSIVLCTQTSLSNLHRIEALAENWGGEVSVAVFTFDEEVPLALEYIMLLHKCSSIVRSKTRFHLVYPIAHPPTDLKMFFEMEFLCSNLIKLQNVATAENYNSNNIPYPVNLVRNIAFMYSSAPYVFNLDTDFIPAKNMRIEMETFLEKRPASEKLRKTAFIIPSFESNGALNFWSKDDVLAAIKNKTVRQFTYFKCYRCQFPTNYSKWISLPYASEMQIGYYIKFEMPYEPYYIADRKGMPMFDARFKQYGMNRVSQICESFYSGYEFAVMNNAFVIHDGFKDPEMFHTWKKTQNTFNRVIFDTIFKQDLKLRHPHSNRECVYMQMQAGTMPYENDGTFTF